MKWSEDEADDDSRMGGSGQAGLKYTFLQATLNVYVNTGNQY